MQGFPRLIGIVSSVCLLTACGGGGGGSDEPDAPGGPAPASASLARVADCDELHEAIRADARRKVEVQADELRTRGWIYAGGFEPEPVPSATPAAAPGPQATLPPPGPREATDTNTQVPGVDEPDVVEIEGPYLYLLRAHEVVVLDAGTPSPIVASFAVEGRPLGMFVHNGVIVVLSEVVDDTGRLGGGDRCDGIGPPLPILQHVDQPIAGGVPFVPTCYSRFLKVTEFTPGNDTGTPARTVRELYIEGDYVSARRHGADVRTVVQRDWGVPRGFPEAWSFLTAPTPPTSEADFRARVDEWEAAALAAIADDELADWLPARRERIEGALVDRPLGCADAYAPEIGLTQQGTTVITGFDLTDTDAPLADTVLVGRASQVYANGETLVLAYPEWQVTPFEDAGDRTALHVFALPAASLATQYLGSGFLPGTLLSQFAIDARDGVLRVATTFTSDARGQIVTRVVTARIENEALVTLGSTPDLAPGERLFGVRFLGDRAYLVTFLVVDPLFVVDLADPAHPTVLGEVELPGFSEYLHPLGDHHLLTLGQAATAEGRILGAAVRIFDVADPTRPALVDEQMLAADAWSPAASNHLAFTYDARLGLLAVPINRFNALEPSSLFVIGVDPVAGLDVRAEVTHPASGELPCFFLAPEPLCPTYAPMERGLFVDDRLLSLSADTLQVQDLPDLATPLWTVRLP